jgi:hypothetical protein
MADGEWQNSRSSTVFHHPSASSVSVSASTTEVTEITQKSSCTTQSDAPRGFPHGATAASTSVLAGLSGRRRTVAIVGAGMAGISLAWLLDGQRDVVVLEARDTIGGNVRSVDVELDGHRFVVDMGAQYFHPGPYPLYTALLSRLGVYPPESTRPEQSHSFPASITVENPAELVPASCRRAYRSDGGRCWRRGTGRASSRSRWPSGGAGPRRLDRLGADAR